MLARVSRPYTAGAGRWLVIVWEAAALALFGWSTVDLFGLTGPRVGVLAAVVVAIWAVGGWRILRMGVYVGPSGLRILGLLRCRTMRWEQVVDVRLHRHTGPFVPAGLTVLIDCRDGSTVNTELWAQGVDFHSRPQVFREVFRELRDCHMRMAPHG
jgi:hypothetical protein